MDTACLTEQALSGRDLAVREIPTFPGFGHRAFVLVHRDHGIEAADVTEPPVPVLSVAAAHSRADACLQFLEWCFEQGDQAARYGVGRSEEEARRRAEAAAQEAVAVAGTGLRPVHSLRSDAEPDQQWTTTEQDLPGIDGRLVITDRRSESRQQTTLVQLVLGRPPHRLAALGCGPDSHQRARLGVYAKLNAFSMPRSRTAPWIEAALDPAGLGDRAPGRAEHGDGTAPALPASPGSRQPAPRLRTWTDPSGLHVAAAELPADATGRDRGMLDRVDAAGLGLRAPTHLALAHLDRDVALSRRYHEHSKLHVRHRALPVVDGAAMSPGVQNLLAAATRDYRYTSTTVPLVPTAPAERRTLAELLATRRSAAQFSGTAIDLGTLAYILLAAYGVTGRLRPSPPAPGSDQPATRSVGLRATPSAGGLHSNDVFVLVEAVQGVEPGLYYFHPDLRCLQSVDPRLRVSDLAQTTGYAERVRSAAAVVLLAGAFSRNQWKYWERGYRMVLLDCGHLAQSLTVAATEADVVAHPIGGFVDDQVNAMLGLDGIDDAVLHLLLLGTRKGSR